MLIIDEAIKARGIFTLITRRNGIVIDEYVDDNLIVDQGRGNVCRLLAGDATRAIGLIGFGTSGTAADPGNVALTGAYTKAIDGFTYPTPTSVQFNFSLGNNEANGLGIQEFGLLTTGGLLHARKVRGGIINKDSDLSLSGTWQLLY